MGRDLKATWLGTLAVDLPEAQPSLRSGGPWARKARCRRPIRRLNSLRRAQPTVTHLAGRPGRMKERPLRRCTDQQISGGSINKNFAALPGIGLFPSSFFNASSLDSAAHHIAARQVRAFCSLSMLSTLVCLRFWMRRRMEFLRCH